ncbi:MAG: gamma carbonic anhydrase family protein [Deltaproteobacteria bacterium]|nr:gamma carbonic anhydrase family protein [Deltaproteobacteria bacterium]
MAVYRFDNFTPEIQEGCYIAESAQVIGNVKIGKGCYIGPNAILRGDYGQIVIGEQTAVEEGVIIHARPGEITTIGNRVTLGHGAIIHNCTIEDSAVIGMGAVVSDYAIVREWGVVAEGAVVKNKSVVESGSVVAGIPAREVGRVSEEYKAKWNHFKDIYFELASTYPARLIRL